VRGRNNVTPCSTPWLKKDKSKKIKELLF